MPHLRILYDFIDAMDRRERHIVGAEVLDPVLQRVTRELRVERSTEGFVVVDALLTCAEALVAAQLRHGECVDQTFPEFLQRREMDGNQATIGSPQDVRL